ncbi:MAG: hypothetical protein Q4A87_00180 [Streptococcus sp.]|nr:hypothetical protein [Streptococcus sp.]
MSINRLFQENNPKKFIKKFFKVLCIAGAILTFVFTCYQFTDSIFKNKRNDASERLQKFVKAGKDVYTLQAKKVYLMHLPEFSKSIDQKLVEIELKQLSYQNTSDIQIFGNRLNSHYSKVLKNVEDIEKNSEALLEFSETPILDKESEEYKNWYSNNQKRVKKYEESLIDTTVYYQELKKYEDEELKIIDSDTLGNFILHNLFLVIVILFLLIVIAFLYVLVQS